MENRVQTTTLAHEAPPSSLADCSGTCEKNKLLNLFVYKGNEKWEEPWLFDASMRQKISEYCTLCFGSNKEHPKEKEVLEDKTSLPFVNALLPQFEETSWALFDQFHKRALYQLQFFEALPSSLIEILWREFFLKAKTEEIQKILLIVGLHYTNRKEYLMRSTYRRFLLQFFSEKILKNVLIFWPSTANQSKEELLASDLTLKEKLLERGWAVFTLLFFHSSHWLILRSQWLEEKTPLFCPANDLCERKRFSHRYFARILQEFI